MKKEEVKDYVEEVMTSIVKGKNETELNIKDLKIELVSFSLLLTDENDKTSGSIEFNVHMNKKSPTYNRGFLFITYLPFFFW